MFKHVFLACALILLSACATSFPSPQSDAYLGSSKLDGRMLFQQTFDAHGGAKIDELHNLNVGLTGRWKQLIRRIQPLVTDFNYRVDSQERLFPKDQIYAAQYTGPAGTKSVYRSSKTVAVHYNSVESKDPQVLSSTALTADAFHLFLLGPLGLDKWHNQFNRIADAKLAGKLYFRIHLTRTPGFGYSQSDQVVLWIDPATKLTKLIQITLEGHSTTKCAHVEVEYLDYVTMGSYIFPVKFFERVNAPIAIDAHAWQLTSIDINRAYQKENLQGPLFTGAAATDTPQ